VIPKDYITEWRSTAPWSLDVMVEQDLVISRALVEIFRVPELAERLAFRGGTALYKLHLTPAARYSEDIDLVQIRAEPIGECLDAIRVVLDPWLGSPRRQFKEGRVNLAYRFGSEDSPPVRLRMKIEINSREHFTELGLLSMPYGVRTRWFDGEASITTYRLEELLGTKLRALYQRSKGRDLFDLWHAIQSRELDTTAVIACFQRYMAEGGHRATRAQVEANLLRKRDHPSFSTDVRPLLRPDIEWDFEVALESVLEEIVSRLPGGEWRGSES
jgi:predicted nucleotidyltransferase component of viral defense system